MAEDSGPRFDDYLPRRVRGSGPTASEETRDRVRHAWPAYVLTGAGVVLVVVFGMLLGRLDGRGPLDVLIGLTTGAVFLTFRRRLRRIVSGDEHDND